MQLSTGEYGWWNTRGGEGRSRSLTNYDDRYVIAYRLIAPPPVMLDGQPHQRICRHLSAGLHPLQRHRALAVSVGAQFVSSTR